jgi:hypothetical protein
MPPTTSLDQPAETRPAAAASTGAQPTDVRPQRNLRRTAVLLTLLLAGLGGLGGGGYGLFREFTRGPTQAELARAGNAEEAQRWRELPVGKIFPAVIPYTTYAGNTEHAHRVGILPAGNCGGAADPAGARVLAAHGCRAVLRATYTDPSGTALVTIGVAVMPSSAAAGSAADALAPGGNGVLPAGFAGTIARSFGGDQRLAHDNSPGLGRYLAMVAVGYADGRPVTEMPSAVRDLASAVEGDVEGVLNSSVPPCSAKDVRC